MWNNAEKLESLSIALVPVKNDQVPDLHAALEGRRGPAVAAIVSAATIISTLWSSEPAFSLEWPPSWRAAQCGSAASRVGHYPPALLASNQCQLLLPLSAGDRLKTRDLSTQTGTLALAPQVVEAVKVPVIAAGGIADARGIAAAFALGLPRCSSE